MKKKQEVGTSDNVQQPPKYQVRIEHTFYWGGGSKTIRKDIELPFVPHEGLVLHGELVGKYTSVILGYTSWDGERFKCGMADHSSVSDCDMLLSCNGWEEVK